MNPLFQALTLLSRPEPPPPPQAIELPRERAYGGAAVNRMTTDFTGSGASADAEILTGLSRLRANSRQLVRDSDYARRAIHYIASNVIGTGIDFLPAVKNADGSLDGALNQEIKTAWEEWTAAQFCDVAGRLGFYDMELLLVKSLVENGEFLIRMIDAPFGQSSVALGLQALEPDFLIETWNVSRTGTGSVIKQGVEQDQWGRPIAYHLYTSHPGEIFYSAGIGERQIRVAAADVLHGYIPDRIGQSRGVPWMHTALIRMKDLSGYEHAEITRARASANIVGVWESQDSPTPDLVKDGQRQEYLEPGTIIDGLPGDKFQGFNPSSPNPNAGSFISYMLRGAAAGLGISYAGLTGDYSDSNYSSSRLGQYSERDYFRIIQAWYIRTIRRPLYARWLQQAHLSGRLPIRDFYTQKQKYLAADFRPRGWGWTSPKDDIPAYIAARRAGLMSSEQIVAESSGSNIPIADTYARIAEEQALAEKLGVILQSDVSHTDDSGKLQFSVSDSTDSSNA